RRDSHIDRSNHAAPGLDSTEPRDRQVLLMLRGSLKPSVIRDVDEEIDSVRRGANVLPRQCRIGVFVTDHAGKVIGPLMHSERKPGPLFARLATVVAFIGRKGTQEWQVLFERHVLTKRNKVNLVVASTRNAIGIHE